MPLNSKSDARPLAGKRIVVTRASEQSGELAAALEALGAEVLLLPMMRFLPPEDWADVDSAIKHLDKFDWVLFTSQNSLRFLTKRVFRTGSMDVLRRLRIGAVGLTTLTLAKAEGLNVNFVPQTHTGKGLAQELAGELKDKRVLVPRSDRADSRFSSTLRDAGAKVTECVAYRTVAAETIDEAILRRVRDGEVDALIFASPSAFHNLGAWIPLNELAELSKGVRFAAIGPTTARALREAGAQVAVEASDASAGALTDAIVSYYKKHPTVARRA